MAGNDGWMNGLEAFFQGALGGDTMPRSLFSAPMTLLHSDDFSRDKLAPT
ncbi:uncharacterized protein CLUP02_04813 [Colletotrichum lupini]|uniref:Uncharacterized protein n=1 Tax=Colletotrichum lupini TaxID=145971 RepID=A0A9Q8SL30_9PEZI|nr:uncharacterized protein CLUP02_04813 [Colletotrichum lupini]UQC79334.1 hypothetical protein CLUP02_04813 [Colletotrichum lupini]